MSFKRLVPSAGLAVGVTCLITLAMAAMIKQDFTPEDKPEKLALEINPVAVDIKAPPPREKPQEVKRVETPPPPPIIERIKSPKPTEPIVDETGEIPIFKAPKIDPTDYIITVSDRNVEPLVRIAPIMPPRAEKSGHCNVRFNVSAQGVPYDVQATYCTQSLFERATVKSVSKWKYRPKIVNGRAVAMTGVENKVSYRLTDERGNIIPE
ncbi:energy transducer TonB [Hellea balneolensis]|uniref:energy transducer TonB n=1 Tax=Hellea balneolensis TaxID=287478 RepID=UPI000412B51E|nr:energy transducer TonB [Hellea balneolensis]